MHLFSDAAVEIWDDVLTEFELKLMYNHFLRKKYSIVHTSDADLQSRHTGQQGYYLTDEDLELDFIKKLISKVDRPFMRAYVQYYHPTQELYLHVDASSSVSTITWFHPEYDVRWGGELMIYGEETVGVAVQPLPGRMVSFKGGEYAHIGRPFNHLAKYKRFYLVMNFN